MTWFEALFNAVFLLTEADLGWDLLRLSHGKLDRFIWPFRAAHHSTKLSQNAKPKVLIWYWPSTMWSSEPLGGWFLLQWDTLGTCMDPAYFNYTRSISWNVGDLSAASSGSCSTTEKKKKKTTIFQTQDLLLEMFMAWTRWIRWADHSGLLSDIESLLKKYVALTGFAKLFMNAHIFTQDRSRESKIWHGTSCQLLSCIFVSNQIAIRTLLRINLLYLICWKIWTLKSCKTGRKCFFTFQ